MDFDPEKKMITAKVDVENLTRTIAGMDRATVIRALLNFDGRMKLDFTPEYLEKQSTERLQHILFAARCHELD